MEYTYKNYGSRWKYAIFIIVQETVRFYCWANKNEVRELFGNRKLIHGYKFFARLLTGNNALEIEEKKNKLIDN